MNLKLTIALELADGELREELAALCRNLPDVEVVIWQDGVGEKGPAATRAEPDIVIIDEAPRYGTLAERIRALRQQHDHVAVFVAAKEQKPDEIVAVMKAGASEYLLSPVNKKIFAKALDDFRESSHSKRRNGHGRFYSFISAKGGLGATVLSTNASVSAVHQHQQKASLCDLSCESGDSSVLLDITPKTNIADIADNFHRLDLAMFRGCMSRHDSGLEVLSAPYRLEQCDTIRPEHISRILEFLAQMYDIIFVDCTSMHINASEVEAFRSSEKIFIVTELSVPALRNATRLAQYIGGLGVPPQQIEFIVNRFYKGSALSLAQAEETLKQRVFWLFPNEFNDVMQSINEGTPIVQLMPHAPFSESVKAFVHQLLNPQADPKFRGVRGRFGKAI